MTFFFVFLSVQTFSINGKQTMEFLDKDLEFLAGTGAGEGMSFYEIKDVIVNTNVQVRQSLVYVYKLEKLHYFILIRKLS